MKNDSAVDSIDYLKFETVEDMIDLLLEKLETVEHGDYESVKLYGNGELMLSIIKLFFTLDKYSHLQIGCLHVTASWFDMNETSEYVLEISDDYTVCIQNAIQDDVALLNESKFTICMNYCNQDIFDNVISEGTALVIANLSTKK